MKKTTKFKINKTTKQQKNKINKTDTKKINTHTYYNQKYNPTTISIIILFIICSHYNATTT